MRSSLFLNPSDLTTALPLGTLLRMPQRQAAVSLTIKIPRLVHLTHLKTQISPSWKYFKRETCEKMSSNATSLSNLRRLGYRSVQRTQQQPALDRFKSSSQDLLNENNIKSRLEEELNWFEGSRPAKSIENLLAPTENTNSRVQKSLSKSRIPAQGNVDEKKRRLVSQGLFSNQQSSASPSRSGIKIR